MNENELPPVEDIDPSSITTVQDLMEQMGRSGGFTAKKVYEATTILRDMIQDEDCYSFLSFPACIISTGTRGVIKELIKRRWVDCVITTCGTLDHDLARIWRKYYHGSFEMDDVELHKKDIHRLGNILIPMDSYGIILERKMREMMEEIWKKGQTEFSTREIVREIGKRIDDESSITYWAAKNDIPVTPATTAAKMKTRSNTRLFSFMLFLPRLWCLTIPRGRPEIQAGVSNFQPEAVDTWFPTIIGRICRRSCLSLGAESCPWLRR